jgi:AcrR family transcriptional regulator
MLDATSTEGRAIAALMRLSEIKPWRDIFLADIAAEAGLSYAELTAAFDSKAKILSAFVKAVDREAARRMAEKPATDGPRDRLFDAIMTRFDVLAPYRAALKRLVQETPELGLAIDPMARLKSMRMTLESARIDADSAIGCLKLAGVGGVYARTFKTWLDDDDPGQARTMAKLDRQLRSGERAMQTVDDIAGGFERVVNAFRSRRRRDERRPEEPSAPPAANI